MGTLVGRAVLVILIGGMVCGQAAQGQEASPAPVSPPSARSGSANQPNSKAPHTLPSERRGGGAYLGVDLRDLTPDRLSALKLNNGVEVTIVDQDAPAAKAGIRERDVITSFNGQKVEGSEQLRRQIRSLAPGQKVKLGLFRDGHPLEISLQLADRRQVMAHRPGAFAPPPPGPPPGWDVEMPQFSMLPFWVHNGLMVEDLTPQLGEFFGVRNGEGVLVRAIEKGSPAEAAGLRAGDVIIKVNGEHITCSSDWRHALRRQQGGMVTLGVVRDKREQAISVKLPERRSANPRHSEPEFDGAGFEPAQEQMTDSVDSLNRWAAAFRF